LKPSGCAAARQRPPEARLEIETRRSLIVTEE
jgi:hypothetical protein